MSSGRSLAPWLSASISRTVSVHNGRQKQQIESRAHNRGFQHHRSGQRVPHDAWGVKCCDSIGERDGPIAVAGVLVVALPIVVTCRGCRELTSDCVHSIGEPGGRVGVAGVVVAVPVGVIERRNHHARLPSGWETHKPVLSVCNSTTCVARSNTTTNTNPEKHKHQSPYLSLFGGRGTGCSLLPALFTKPLVESLAVCMRLRISPLRRKQA
ncbi:hypothetical protein L1887_54787 [Cichorium endivia]|nr:hypothetical protein L1887_54787 [Cichorium endivia]